MNNAIYIALCVLLYTQSALPIIVGGGGGLSSTTTSVQHPLGLCYGCHRTTAPVRSPHTSYRWRRERVIEPIKCMRSPHTSYRWRGERAPIEPIKCMRSPLTATGGEERESQSQSSGCTHHTPATGGRGERVIEANQVYALTTHQLQVERRESQSQSSGCARHTTATGGEERESQSQSSVCARHTPATGGEERESQSQSSGCARHTPATERERESQSQSSVCARHTPATVERREIIEPIKWMRSPHTSYRWRGRETQSQSSGCARHTPATGGEEREYRANQVYARHTPATGGEERVIEPIKCMRSHTSYRWRGERVQSQSSVCAHTQLQVERRESHRANQVYALTTHQLQVEERERVQSQSSVCATTHQLQVERRGVIEPIKCMRSPHTSYRWRGESHRANQVDALATHQLQVERRESIEPIKCMRSPHTSYSGEERESQSQSSGCARHTPATGGGGESHRANQVSGARHTPATGGEERDHRANQVYALAHTPATRWRGGETIRPINWDAARHTTHVYRWRGRRDETQSQSMCMRSPPHQLQVERRESHRANQVYWAHHTPSYRWREERVIEPITCMRSPHTSYRWRGEKSQRKSSVCAHPHTRLEVARRERESQRPIKVYALANTPATSGEGEDHIANQVYALATHQLQVEGGMSETQSQSSVCVRHTSYRWRGERVIEPIKCMRSPTQLQVERRERHRANQVDALTTHSYR